MRDFTLLRVSLLREFTVNRSLYSVRGHYIQQKSYFSQRAFDSKALNISSPVTLGHWLLPVHTTLKLKRFRL